MTRPLGILALSLALCVSIGVSAQDDLETRLQQMSLQQKVGQMFMVTFYGYPPNEPARELLATWQPGAVALLPDNIGSPTDITNLTNSIQQSVIQAGGVPLFIAVDQEGGIIAHLKDGFTEFPVPSLLTASNDTDLAYRVGQAVAQELLAVGINMNLAPVADLNTNPANPIIGRRSFGTYPDQVAPIVSAWARGLQDAHVMATAKHFPGHGDTATDSHTTLPIITYGMDRLQQVELMPFKALIDAQVGAVMVAHIYFSQLEAEANLPASLSTNIVTHLLREDLTYKGIIMTDAMDMDAIDTVYSPSERAIRAIEAGNDFVLLGAHISPEDQIQSMQSVIEAVQNGQLSESRIDESVRRILLAKAQFGVLDWQTLDPSSTDARLNTGGHASLIDELFYDGITVVKDSAQLLPLTDGTLFIYPASRPSLWNTCQQTGLQPLGVSTSPTDEEIAWARTSAQIAPKVIVFTQNAIDDPQQVKLVNALPADKTIVVALQAPNDIATFPSVGAYMVTYSPMLSANQAICDILLGRVLPRGTISVSLDH